MAIKYGLVLKTLYRRKLDSIIRGKEFVFAAELQLVSLVGSLVILSVRERCGGRLSWRLDGFDGDQ